MNDSNNSSHILNQSNVSYLINSSIKLSESLIDRFNHKTLAPILYYNYF